MPDPSTYRPAPGTIPDKPGVYRFRDPSGRVIYVGKAKSLRSRLNSYFADTWTMHARTQQMVTTAASVDWVTVGTEVEALQLEYNWIKEYDPRFNVRYRDDKTYPYLAVTLFEEFPRLQVMRGAKRKGVRYFGPYSHAWAIRETLDLLLRVFPARTCSAGVFKRAGQIGRPCLLGYIGKCSAPCTGQVTAEEHRRIVEDFCDFMAGRTDTMVKRLEKEMQAAAERARVRAGCARARRPHRAQAGGREAGRGVRRRHRRRRGRVRRRPARGGRAGLPRARRPSARAARLGGREDRGPVRRRPGPPLLHAGLRRRRRGRRRGHPPGAARPRAAGRRRRARRVAVRPARQPGDHPRAAARGQEGAGRDGQAKRRRRRWPSTSSSGPAT